MRALLDTPVVLTTSLAYPLCLLAVATATLSAREPGTPSLGDAPARVVAARADGVTLNPRFVTGQKLTYKLVSKIEVPQREADSALPPKGDGPQPPTPPAPSSTPPLPTPKPAAPEKAPTPPKDADAFVGQSHSLATSPERERTGEANNPLPYGRGSSILEDAFALPAPAGDPVRYFSMEATIRLTTLGTDEQGNATMVVLFSELHGEMGEGGALKAGLTLTESGLTRKGEEKPAGAEPVPGPPPGTATMPDDTPLAAVTSALMASTIRIDVRADGTVSDITGLEDAYAVAAKQADGARLLGPFAPGVVTRSLAALFRVDEPDKAGKYIPRSAADTWTLTDQWALNSTSTLVRTTTCSLETLTPELAKITAKGQAVIRKKETPAEPVAARPRGGAKKADSELEPAITIVEQSDESTVEWNPTEGVLISRVRQSSMTTKAQVGGHEGAPQEVRSKMEIRLKRD